MDGQNFHTLSLDERVILAYSSIETRQGITDFEYGIISHLGIQTAIVFFYVIVGDVLITAYTRLELA